MVKKGIVFSICIIYFLLIAGGANAQIPSAIAPSIGSKYDVEINSLISKLTLEEKVSMLHGNSMFATGGVPRLGIPELKMADGPLGIREEISRDSWAAAGWTNDFATYYPATGALAATWNTRLAYTFGNSVGQELRARGKDMLLSPAINIVRTPLGGRTYEYLTEDPFLNKSMAVPMIVGLQKNDVIACVKHFAANNQETNRDFVDVQMEERTLREIYLPAFEAAIKEAKAYGIMGAYNKFRSEYLCESDYMLNKILRGEWGFNGVVVSDWAAVHSTVKSLKNGLDIEMGTPKPFNQYFLADKLIAAVKAGEISESEINLHVKRILRTLFQVKAMGNNIARVKGSIATEAHYKDAYDIASESIVLLKNENNTLPLHTDGVKRIAVIGNNATKKNALGGFGAGVKTRREITPLEGLKSRLPRNMVIDYVEGYLERYEVKNKGNAGDITINRPVSIDELEPAQLKQAIEAAKNADMTIVFAGANRDYETEASDRSSLKLPFGQEELINKVLEVNPNTIVVLIGGAPYDIGKIKNKTKALVWSWFNGSEGGNALADVLLGKINPSGKLPWTMPEYINESPAHATHSFPGDKTVTYKEGVLVGYRWFDTKKIEPLYPFGYGLSYASFNIDKLSVNKKMYKKSETITVKCAVKNTGKRYGAEVVQLYISQPVCSVMRPEKELKAFKKVFLQPGETKVVEMNVKVADLAFYDEQIGAWNVESGNFILQLGNSSRNIFQKKEILVK